MAPPASRSSFLRKNFPTYVVCDDCGSKIPEPGLHSERGSGFRMCKATSYEMFPGKIGDASRVGHCEHEYHTLLAVTPGVRPEKISPDWQP